MSDNYDLYAHVYVTPSSGQKTRMSSYNISPAPSNSGGAGKSNDREMCWPMSRDGVEIQHALSSGCSCETSRADKCSNSVSHSTTCPRMIGDCGQDESDHTTIDPLSDQDIDTPYRSTYSQPSYAQQGYTYYPQQYYTQPQQQYVYTQSYTPSQ